MFFDFKWIAWEEDKWIAIRAARPISNYVRVLALLQVSLLCITLTVAFPSTLPKGDNRFNKVLIIVYKCRVVSAGDAMLSDVVRAQILWHARKETGKFSSRVFPPSFFTFLAHPADCRRSFSSISMLSTLINLHLLTPSLPRYYYHANIVIDLYL